ncbi:type I restriction endonuclease subunit R [Acidicapsa ligni]|uniref:type I restriction endonuclease subunit R n=1 Tax=Acidicapsa ligni TaxID=542300 RepID=UPI0021E01E5F|nr:type I restriction endonuclease subunit R [Acidicapsa ligni]
MITGINSEDRLVQTTFATHLEKVLGWDSIYAYNTETFGPESLLGRTSEKDVVLVRDLRVALQRLNSEIPEAAREQAIEKLTRVDLARSLVQHNRDFYSCIRNGVPVEWRDAKGETRHAHARVIDFQNINNNRFLAVRELKIQGVRVPHYNRRADLVCFVNGLPLVFIELKAVYRNIRAGFDDNLTDYLTEHSIAHAFHHNVFLVVSNGDQARYGSITSKWDHFAEWKRNDEKDKARLDAEALLDGMLSKERLLDIVENFILFDDSRAGGARKIVARNHQVLGVNNAIESVMHQEKLKLRFPMGERLIEYLAPMPERLMLREPETRDDERLRLPSPERKEGEQLPLVKRAHEDLGRLGVFWHTQGSGKSYSMAFFTEKVRRVVPGNFTFVVMTDRDDLDDQIWRTFIGCGVSDEKTPRAASGKELKEILLGNHRFVFTLIHKFNQPVTEPYSERDDIIVVSDEAHRTQAGKFARNMRLALPNASFIGFTGTPLFKYDELTRRIFGGYISKYDFKRSEEDHSTVKLVYENRGEKLGLARLDLNDRIADAVEKADLDPDQTALLEKLLGKDYEVITADDRLDKLADDFVEHCSTRWQTGKSMFVCIDKITCARMFKRMEPRWNAKVAEVQALVVSKETELCATIDVDTRENLKNEVEHLRGKAAWMASTLIEIIISEAQNEVRDFNKWDFDIIPHRVVMKTGFQTPDGKRVLVEDAFKDPGHPFRIAIVCAMWLTGFDVECLATLYIDKPMRAHNLMQAIARANRVYPGKDCGVIVDYNGMLKSLRQALAKYAVGDGEDGNNDGSIVAPIEELVAALIESIEATENHLLGLGFDSTRLNSATGFTRIQALRDAVDAVYTSDETKRRFEIMAREVFSRFKALLMEPSALKYAVRHDNIEAIYKKLQDKRDTADVTELLKELHRIVNEAIRAADLGDDHADGLTIDLSQIDFAKLKDEFAQNVPRKHAAIQDIRDIVEAKLRQMLAANPLRMDYYKKYQEIIADYNREKDRVTVEATFAELIALAASLDAEQRRAAEEGLSDDELALFDLLFKDKIGKADRERLKQASKTLLVSLEELLKPIQDWTQKTTTQAEVKVLILNDLYRSLPRPPFTDEEIESASNEIYNFVWQKSASNTTAWA